MPELPEVETVVRILRPQLIGRTITGMRITFNKIIRTPDLAAFSKAIVKQKINNLTRRAKYLLFWLDDYVLISHLRMEGKYFVNKPSDMADFKHIILVFTLDNGLELRYHDTRRFGTFDLIPHSKYLTMKPLSQLGYEPFDPLLTSEYLQKAWSKKTIPIKTALLQQDVIVGIGNIYANEILFACGISPFKSTKMLQKAELINIIKQTKIILQAAINQGGTTIFSFHAQPGIDGKFKQQLKVHGRLKQTCYQCGQIIKKTKVNGRGTYWCERCQS